MQLWKFYLNLLIIFAKQTVCVHTQNHQLFIQLENIC